jgi:GxxExxY protein
LDEKLYENALVIELVARRHTVEQQREYPVHYRGHFIGRLVPDVIVDGKVVADPKVVSAFNDTHIAQMLAYLNITGLEVALLLNFKEATLTWKQTNHGLHRFHGFISLLLCRPRNPALSPSPGSLSHSASIAAPASALAHRQRSAADLE